MINDNGLILWESNSIVRYLSRQYSTEFLYLEDPEQAELADQWIEWTKTSVTSNLMPAFWGLIRLPKEQQDMESIKQSAINTEKVLSILENHLEDREFIIGNSLTMADIPLGTSIYRYLNLDIERPRLPNIESWYDTLYQNPAYQQHAMIAFGRSLDEWNALEKADASGSC